jgi:hypothetical protein
MNLINKNNEIIDYDQSNQNNYSVLNNSIQNIK